MNRPCNRISAPLLIAVLCGCGEVESASEKSGLNERAPEDGTDEAAGDLPTAEDTALHSPHDSSAEEREAVIWLLAGQSNMAGISQTTALPPSLQVAQPDVAMYSSSHPVWRQLQPDSPHSNGSANFMGPEATFGRTLADALPDTDVYLIKHAVSGTNLYAFWNPGSDAADTASMGEGYTVFKQVVDDARLALQAQGVDARFGGMIWMQGESDASEGAWASDNYEANLTHLISRVREDVSTPELSFSIGLIACDIAFCTGLDVVRSAQQAVADADAFVSTVETADLEMNFDDVWHYTGQSMRVMGKRFAQAQLGLPQSLKPRPALTLSGQWSYDYFGDFTIGWSFTIDEPIVITDVGQFDIEWDGLNKNTSIGFWRVDDAALLSVTPVPSQWSGPSSNLGGFRMVGTEPLYLHPGEYVVGSQTFSFDFDWYVYNAVYTPSVGIEIGSARHEPGSVLAFPTQVNAISDGTAAWFGPNFHFLLASEYR